MNEVVIHIGAHKTGTTSIQESLVNYDDGDTIYARLQGRNHSIPLYTIFSKERDKYHIWRRQGLSNQQIEERRRNFLNAFNKNLCRKDRKKLILSGEDVSLLKAEEKKTLLNHVRDRVENIEVICYFRPPLGFAASNFQQRIKSGLASLPEKVSPRYKHRIEAFRTSEKIRKLIVKEYSRQKLSGGDVVCDFCSEFGLIPSKKNNNLSNESLSVDAIKLLYKFNKEMPLLAGDSILSQARQAFIADLRRACSPARMDEKYFYCLADYSEVDFLDEKFGIRFCEEMSNSMPTRAESEDFLEDLSGVDLQGIDAILDKHKIKGDFQTPTAKMVRLFMWHVYKQQALVHAESEKES